MTDLSSYPQSVGTELYVKIDIEGVPLLLTDADFPRTVLGNTYNNLSSLMGITATVSSIRASNYAMNINISGLPAANLAGAFSDDVKGCAVTVYRGFIDPNTRELIDTVGGNNPIRKFTGIVENVGFNESYDAEFSTFEIVFNCVSQLGMLRSHVAGRKTNLRSQQKFFINDTAFKRVAKLRNSNFNFGSPNPAPRFGTNS
jgi:hypothetical protein